MLKKKSAYYWSLSLDQTLSDLGCTLNGLSDKDAKDRLEFFGENIASKYKPVPNYIIFIEQFKSPLIALLFISVIFSFIVSERVEGLIIILILLINSIFSFIQEYKANAALEFLSKYIGLKTKVSRNGKISEIDSKFLVPGDIVILSVGDVVPADIRLFEMKNFTLDESTLTGESLPVEKSLEDTKKDSYNPADVKDIIFAGTTVSSGFVHGLVIATGDLTYVGGIAHELKRRSLSTFHEDVVKLGYFLMKITIAVAIFVFIVNFYMQKGFVESALFALAISIGMTPELLPFIITANLSKSALIMARHSVIVKKLVSIELLGNMDILCTDKTGTLTEGVLSLNKFLTLDGQPDFNLLWYACLCRESVFLDRIENPIDKAIILYVKNNNLEKNLQDYKLVDSAAFDFFRRRLSVLVSFENKNMFIAKGAPDSVLSICSQYYSNGQLLDIASNRNNILSKVSDYENDGYRVIAVA